ncbi:glucuronate isomerase [Parageobacillus thermoglucosidasius]|uniref:glucuronate isomerase n=1 Tax=Parageobacillus thermoglucosidasius TaxID=1426 RepID=UPI000E11D121|nr:glucuronate isomerase [Parageobacillus thermoglucosidasius]RDE27416.1 glucuronate isomerase [Parageobacillus thermoglucosidasius]
MRAFLDENFLLSNDTAVRFYHQFAKDMPIIDYHCHLSPKEIYEDKRFNNITEVWLYGDHYKWRAMRANGIKEEYITGNASDYEKFLSWAKTVPMTIGNPLYHWTHLELRRFFGIEELINEKSAPYIWEKTNDLLKNDEAFTVRNIIKKSNVEVICTTDDPTDSLQYHQKLQECDDFPVKVLPSFRPDKGLEINRDGFLSWIQQLEEVTGISITSYSTFLQALRSRVEFFHSVGCRLSDHALDTVVYEETTTKEVETIFAKALNGHKVDECEERKFKTLTLIYLGEMYAQFGWAMQFHMNALRNNNTKMYKILGPDTGYDCMNDSRIAVALVRLLDSLEQKGALPKTILYSLNPNDNHVIASIIGSFQGDGIPGKIQFGTAWWFNDTRDGMVAQMKTLANVGLLSRFIGMLTDSRSFLSYVRHEYFRRIVCNLIGEWVENGEVPNDMELLGNIVQRICYYNAKEYFSF